MADDEPVRLAWCMGSSLTCRSCRAGKFKKSTGKGAADLMSNRIQMRNR
jgi:hypothetical protein